MNWRRIAVEGADPKHYKKWRGGKGRYEIIWRDQAFGIAVAPGYHVLVKVEGEWDLITRQKRLRRTLKAAKRACEVHANSLEKRK